MEHADKLCAALAEINNSRVHDRRQKHIGVYHRASWAKYVYTD